MIAAIYSCKSTDDSEKDPVAKSTQLQIDGATAYAAKQAERSTPATSSSTRTPQAPSGRAGPASMRCSPRSTPARPSAS